MWKGDGRMNVSVRMARAVNCKHYGVAAGTPVMLDLESEYLPICVGSEIYESNARTPMEAKKAQAVAARTYIAAHARYGNAIDDTANYQAFKWKDLSTIPNSVAACRATSGQVLCYDGTLITAWYSNSNGGRTRRSDEAWSAYKPWTVSQADPWDAAGRVKWGEVKASHGVGMSQIGAAHAASVGVGYAEMLGFYYPGAALVGGYGKINEVMTMSNKTNTGLVAWAQSMVGQPYWYGTCGYKCTQSLLSRKAVQYPIHYSDSRMPRYKQDIAAGGICSDCIGLMKGYLWTREDGTQKYDASTDVNTGGLFSRATVKGVISTIPEVPGLMVYKDGHVGVHEGNGSVVEARGFASGVVRSKIADTAWTHWVAAPWLSYEGYEDLLTGGPETFPYHAQVTTRVSPLNLWNSPAKTTSYAQVARGDTVTVLGRGDVVGWYWAEKDGKKGQADGQYLTRIPSDGQAEEGGVEAEPDTLPLYRVVLPAVSASIRDEVLAVYPGALVTEVG